MLQGRDASLPPPQTAKPSRVTVERARVVTLNAALGPLDYRVPEGMAVEPGSVVVAPLGPRQLAGVVWEPERLPAEEIAEARLRPLVAVLDVPPIPLRSGGWSNGRPIITSRRSAAVLRMVLPSSAALEGPRQLTEYAPTGRMPQRLTPKREQALGAIEGRQGTIRELAAFAGVSDSVMRGLVNAGALEPVQVTRRPAAALPRPRSCARPTCPTSSPGPPARLPAPSARASTRCCSTESPDRARPRSISKRSPNACARGSRRSYCFPRSRLPSPS
jgi:hypothetical protein